MVAASSFGYLQMVLGSLPDSIIIAHLLVPLFYKMNLVSIYEYLENRFGMFFPPHGCLVLLHLQNARCRCPSVPRMPDAAICWYLNLSDRLFLLNVAITVVLVWLYTFQVA